MSSPYVISADLETVNSEFVNEGELDTFRQSLSDDLTDLGKTVEWVEFGDLRQSVARLISGTALPVISLDTRYVDEDEAEMFIGISRAVDKQLDDADYDARLGYDSISVQFERAGSLFVGKEVVVVDDVIFSGHNMCWITDMLAERGVTVRGAIGGVAIGEAEHRLAERGIEMQSAKFFEDVDDEICERDFAIVPGSGRKVIGTTGASLYFDPEFGRPSSWASIPEISVVDFFVSSLERNRRLLQTDRQLGDIGQFVGYDGLATVADNLDQAKQRAYASSADSPVSTSTTPEV